MLSPCKTNKHFKDSIFIPLNQFLIYFHNKQFIYINFPINKKNFSSYAQKLNWIYKDGVIIASGPTLKALIT